MTIGKIKVVLRYSLRFFACFRIVLHWFSFVDHLGIKARVFVFHRLEAHPQSPSGTVWSKFGDGNRS